MPVLLVAFAIWIGKAILGHLVSDTVLHRLEEERRPSNSDAPPRRYRECCAHF